MAAYSVQKSKQIYERACGLIAALLLITLTGLVLLSILTRMIGTYIGGVTEFAGYTMAACSFFAMSYTFRHGAHIRVQLLVSHLTGRARRIDDLWCLGVFALVTTYLSYYLCELAYDSWEFGEISEGDGDARMIAAMGALLDFQGASVERPGALGVAGLEIEVGQVVDRHRHDGIVAPQALLLNRQGS